MVSKKTLLILTLFLFVLNTAVIAQTIVTDRPDQTESAVLVPIGSFQIETGMSLGYETFSKTKYRSFIGPNSLFRYGINKIVELRVTNSFLSFKNIDKDIIENGVTDMQIGAKVNLFKAENSNTRVAFLTHLLLPTGTSGITQNSYGTINKLAVSHSLTKSIGVGYNVGYDYFGEGNGTFVYSLSLGFSLSERLGAFAEGYGYIVDFEDNYTNIDFGFTYLIRNNLQFDFSFGSGVNQYMNFISTGISWNIGGYND